MSYRIVVTALVAIACSAGVFWHSSHGLSWEVIEHDEKSNIGLYVKKTDNHNIYITLDISRAENPNGWRRMHGGDFWDPKRCIQMQSVIAEDFLLLSDVTQSRDSKGKNHLVYRLFLFDLERNRLLEATTHKKIQKIYSDGKNFFIMTQKNEATLSLYMLSPHSKKIKHKKNYQIPLGYSLDRLATTIRWCNAVTGTCNETTEHAFVDKKAGLTEKRNAVDVFNVQLSVDGESILDSSTEDGLRAFVIGAIRSHRE